TGNEPARQQYREVASPPRDRTDECVDEGRRGHESEQAGERDGRRFDVRQTHQVGAALPNLDGEEEREVVSKIGHLCAHVGTGTVADDQGKLRRVTDFRRGDTANAVHRQRRTFARPDDLEEERRNDGLSYEPESASNGRLPTLEGTEP